MDITALYAQHLIKENLQENSIKNYISDVRQFIKWKEGISPTGEVTPELIDQFIRATSFTKSKHTIKRKVVGLHKYYHWLTTGDSNKQGSRSRININYLQYFIAIVIILPVIVNALFPPLVNENITYISIDSSLLQKNPLSAQPVKEIDVEGVELAVSGYNIENNKNDLRYLSPIHGVGEIEVGNTKAAIINEKINEDTIINITPKSSTSNQTLYIDSQGDGYAVVMLDRPLEYKVVFNWIAI